VAQVFFFLVRISLHIGQMAFSFLTIILKRRRQNNRPNLKFFMVVNDPAWIPAPHNEVGGFTPSHGTAVLVF
jgi:hypothetical protein